MSWKGVGCLRITFVLPFFSERPIGGFKVVYDYATRLAARGHQVVVAHPQHLERQRPLLRTLRAKLSRSQDLSRNLARFWYPDCDSFTMAFVPSPSPKYLPDADVAVATGWRTAPWVADWPARKGRGYYLIQHYETWDGPKNAVDATWTLPLHKIVIAQWLYDLGCTQFHQQNHMTYVPNGIDFDRFAMQIPPQSRRPDTVGMLYHTNVWKGAADGIAALQDVKERIPTLQVRLFGTPERSADIPSWMDYSCQPAPTELTRLYNEVALFVHTSWMEGWGLTAAEAMACGAALVATDNGGVRDYNEEGVTALFSPPKNVPALAEHIRDLIEEPEARIRLALNGYDHIRQYTWDRAIDRIETLFQGE